MLIQKNKKIKSVVNKTNQIDNTYRNFQMEVLAGDTNMITELVQTSSLNVHNSTLTLGDIEREWLQIQIWFLQGVLELKVTSRAS